MTALLLTELHRFWGRRMVWITSLIVAALTAVIIAVAFTNHSGTPPDDSSAAEAAARDTANCTRSMMQTSPDERATILGDFGHDGEAMTDAEFEQFLLREFCYQDPSWYQADDDRFHATMIFTDDWSARAIDDWSEGRPDSSARETFFAGGARHRVSNDGLTGILPIGATFYLVVAILVGASFVGAEYKAGTVENLLLWEPRRVRVMLTKFAAGFFSSFVLTGLLLGWLSAGLLGLAHFRGTTAAIDGRFWIDLVSTIGRGAFVGGLFFVAAMSVSVIARTTTAAVGVILGWFAVSNFVIELLAKWLRPWELLNNATAFIREADAVQMIRMPDGWWATAYHHGYLAAGAVTVAWVASLATVATVVFARRDID